MLKIFSENTLHLQCIQWFYAQHGNSGAILHHSPNENPRGDKAQMIHYNAKMKKLGRLPGYPDLEIKHNGKCLMIELKSISGVVSPTQKSLFQSFSNAGFDVHIIRSLEEFFTIVNQFMNHENTQNTDYQI